MVIKTNRVACACINYAAHALSRMPHAWLWASSEIPATKQFEMILFMMVAVCALMQLIPVWQNAISQFLTQQWLALVIAMPLD